MTSSLITRYLEPTATFTFILPRQQNPRNRDLDLTKKFISAIAKETAKTHPGVQNKGARRGERRHPPGPAAIDLRRKADVRHRTLPPSSSFEQLTDMSVDGMKKGGRQDGLGI